MYEGCRSANPGNSFRWQNVACCPEHGSIYFAQILESRKQSEPEPDIEPVADDVETEMQLEQDAHDELVFLEPEDDEFDSFGEDEDDWLEEDDDDLWFGDDDDFDDEETL